MAPRFAPNLSVAPPQPELASEAKGGRPSSRISSTLHSPWNAAGEWPVVYPGEWTMTANKDLKRVVRARMKKTGESYTAARAHIIKKPEPKPDYASLAGVSDAAIKEGTGCKWERWVKTLDHYGAERMSHRDIARLVKQKFDTSSWWTQSVAVGYERIKGLRARGQQRDGTFGMTKSRTFNVPVERLYEAWVDDATRSQWLTGAKTKVRTSTRPKSARMNWNDSIIAVGFSSKGAMKSAVALDHPKIPDPETRKKLAEYWSDRLDALTRLIGNSD